MTPTRNICHFMLCSYTTISSLSTDCTKNNENFNAILIDALCDCNIELPLINGNAFFDFVI